MAETPLHEIRTLRGVPAPVERALNAALSRGPGYEPTPIGPAFQEREVSGYYIDFRAKTTSPTAGDLDALPATPLIQLALGWWERHCAGEAGALDRFLGLCSSIEDRADDAGDELHWPIRTTVTKYRLVAPWLSALPQAQAASVFVRARLATGEERYAELAQAAVGPFTRPGSPLVADTPEGPVLEEAPCFPAAHILNGWMSASWGLWDVHLGLGDAACGALFRATIDCLRSRLATYDTGWWSLYSVYPHAVRDLAKPIYHRFHVAQLQVLHRLTREEWLGAAAERWAAYDRPSNRVRALTQKGAFTVADGMRRRRWSAAAAG